MQNSQAMLETLHLTDGSLLHVGVRRLKSAPQKWIALLPESGAGLMRATRQELEELVGRKAAGQFNFIVINKTGLSVRGKDQGLFEKAFRRRKRIEHATEALQHFVPLSDKIFLVGYSEGAYLAPDLAIKDDRVTGLALIGGGTRGWLKEELGNAESREKSALRRQIDRIYREPQSEQKWNGFSFATWYSYRGDQTLHSLRQVRVPVHAVLGGRDRTIDLNATLKDLRRLQGPRRQVDIKVLPRCGHSFGGHWAEVRRILSSAVSF